MVEPDYTDPTGRRRNWADLSDYVVHFVKARMLPTTRPAESSYLEDPRLALEVLLKILHDKNLIAMRPFGIARGLQMLGTSQHSVCMSEAPLGSLDRFVQRRGPYGLGFKRTWLEARQGQQVWYVRNEGTLNDAIYKLYGDGYEGGMKPDAPIWRLTPFIEEYLRGNDWRWEREWRHVGDLAFDPSDIEFLFMPEADHQRATEWFQQYSDHMGASFQSVPLVDPTWTRAAIRERFSNT